MLKNRAGFTVNRWPAGRYDRIMYDMTYLHMYRNDVVFERSKSYRIVRYILLTCVHTPKNTTKIPLEIGSSFEFYFQW